MSTKSTSDNKWWLFRSCYSLEQYSVLSQVMHTGLPLRQNADDLIRMSCVISSRVMNIPTFSRSRKYTSIFGPPTCTF